MYGGGAVAVEGAVAGVEKGKKETAGAEVTLVVVPMAGAVERANGLRVAWLSGAVTLALAPGLSSENNGVDEGAVVTALVPEPRPGKPKGDGVYEDSKSISPRTNLREDQGKLTELLAAAATGLKDVPDGFVVENSDDEEEEGKPVEAEVAAVPNATGLGARAPKLGIGNDETGAKVAAVVVDDEGAPNMVEAGAVVAAGRPAPNVAGTDGVAPKENEEPVAAGRDDGNGATTAVAIAAAGVEPKVNEEG